jgi:hypothetical protein
MLLVSILEIEQFKFCSRFSKKLKKSSCTTIFHHAGESTNETKIEKHPDSVVYIDMLNFQLQKQHLLIDFINFMNQECHKLAF